MFYDLNKINQIGTILNIVESCRGVEQDRSHHPEGDVFNHSIQVYRWAAKESNDLDLIMAALLHDVGKQVDSKGHEKYGATLLNGLISDKTEWLILNHMRFWYYVLGEMRKYKKCLEMASHKWLNELTQLARWDKLGRNPNIKIKYCRLDIIEQLKKKT